MTKKKKKNDYWIERERVRDYDEALAKANKELAKEYKRIYKNIKIDILSLYNFLQSNSQHVLVSDLYKFNRYYDLLNNINEKLTQLGNAEERIIEKTLRDEYIRNSKTLNKELMFSVQLDDDAVKTAIESIWCPDGKHWSQRIWNNMKLLEEKLSEGIVNAVATGCSNRQLIQDLNATFNVSTYQSERLVRTELAFVQNKACLDRYKNAGIKQYRILPAGDDRDCLECDGLADSVFDIDKAVVGVNFPPIHVNCRCAIIAVMGGK